MGHANVTALLLCFYYEIYVCDGVNADFIKVIELNGISQQLRY